MKMLIICTTVVLTAVQGSTAADESLAGKWIKWNPRTVIGTGQTDTILEISGRPGRYYVSYTTGGISRLKTSDGQFVFRTTTSTFSRVRLNTQGDLYFFTVPLPEQEQTIYLKLKMVEGRKALAITQKNGEEATPIGGPFYRTKDNKLDAGDGK